MIKIAAFIGISLGLVCQSSHLSADSVTQLTKKIVRLEMSSGLESAFIGIEVYSLKRHKQLYQENSNRLFLPASNQKLVIAAVALDILKPHYQSHNRLFRNGEIDSAGQLDGDLIIQGNGDPLFSYEQLKAMAASVAVAGIHTLSGLILSDVTLFDSQLLGEGWSWDDESFYYSAPISALNINQLILEYSSLFG